MTFLSLLLIIKIVIVGGPGVLALLFLPKSKLEKSTDITAPTSLFFRLYGVALLSLLVAYSFGIPSAENNIFPWGVVCMGIVANGAPGLLMLLSRSSKQNLILGIVFLLIALGFATAFLFPEAALQKVW